MNLNEGEPSSYWSRRFDRRKFLGAIRTVSAALVLTPIPTAVALEEFSPSKWKSVMSDEEAAAAGDILRPYGYMTIAHDAGNSDKAMTESAAAGIDLVEMDLQEHNDKIFNEHTHQFKVPKTDIVLARVDVKPLRGGLGPPRRTADYALQGVRINNLKGAFVEWKEEDHGRGEFRYAHFREIENRGKQWGLEIRHHTRTLDYFLELAEMVENPAKNAFLPSDADAWNKFIDYVEAQPNNRIPAVISNASSLLSHEKDLARLNIPCYVDVKNAAQAQQLVESPLKVEALFSEVETFRKMRISRNCTSR